MIKTTRLKEPQIPDIELEIEELVEAEAQERAAADGRLQNQIDELKNSPDVVDIVNTKADLDAYDTSKLGENAIIRVLEDETHEGKSAFYRWVGGVWEFIGTAESGDTKSVELTQAEYDALPDEEKMNGTVYYITDGQGGGGKTYTGGKGITVDNTNDTISANDGVIEFTGKIDGGPRVHEYTLTTPSENELRMLVLGTEVEFNESVGGFTTTLRPTEIINDTDWSALWQ